MSLIKQAQITLSKPKEHVGFNADKPRKRLRVRQTSLSHRQRKLTIRQGQVSIYTSEQIIIIGKLSGKADKSPGRGSHRGNVAETDREGRQEVQRKVQGL